MESEIVLKLGLGFFLMIASVFLFFVFWKWLKRSTSDKVKANFIYEDRTNIIKTYYGIVDEIEYDEFKYEYDDNVSIKIKGFKNIYYRVGVKKPLDIRGTFKTDKDGKSTGVNNDVAISYADQKKIIKSKVLQDLLEDDEETLSKGERLILIAVGIVGLTLLLVVWYYSQQAQEVVMNQALQDFIKESVTLAIRG